MHHGLEHVRISLKNRVANLRVSRTFLKPSSCVETACFILNNQLVRILFSVYLTRVGVYLTGPGVHLTGLGVHLT